MLFTKEEHGDAHRLFCSPAFPLEKVQDPTGAGDAFAGGLVGYLAAEGEIDPMALRRAVVHGTVSASFAVETFSVEGIASATREAVDERYEAIRSLVAIEARALAGTAPH